MLSAVLLLAYRLPAHPHSDETNAGPLPPTPLMLAEKKVLEGLNEVCTSMIQHNMEAAITASVCSGSVGAAAQAEYLRTVEQDLQKIHVLLLEFGEVCRRAIGDPSPAVSEEQIASFLTELGVVWSSMVEGIQFRGSSIQRYSSHIANPKNIVALRTRAQVLARANELYRASLQQPLQPCTTEPQPTRPSRFAPGDVVSLKDRVTDNLLVRSVTWSSWAGHYLIEVEGGSSYFEEDLLLVSRNISEPATAEPPVEPGFYDNFPAGSAPVPTESTDSAGEVTS